MVRNKQTAAEYIERHDGEMRVILGELAENAGQINMWWTLAVGSVREDPERALELLIDGEIHLHHHVRLELSSGLRRNRAAIDRLNAELPDDEDDT
jgi:hypothetical protein